MPVNLTEGTLASKPQFQTIGRRFDRAREQIAKAAGFKSWFALTQAYRRCWRPHAIDRRPFVVDPVLPDHFFCMPNEERSSAELAQWWDRPFAQSQPDGTLIVRCLDGLSCDRPTWYGRASDLAEAQAIGKRELLKWQMVRSRPTCAVLGEGRMAMLRTPQHPHEEPVLLQEYKDAREAHEAMERWRRSERLKQ